jgi:hypothetical protein
MLDEKQSLPIQAQRKSDTLLRLLDPDGQESFARLIDFFKSFDPSVSEWLQRSGIDLLSVLPGPDLRKKVITELLDMGRAKWSVAATSLKKLEDVSSMSPPILLSWIRWGNTLADIDKDVAIQYFESSPEVIKALGEAMLDHWVSLGHDIAPKSWKAAREYFRASPEVITKIAPADLEKWANIGKQLIEKSPRIKAAYGAHSLLAQGTSAGKAKMVDLAVQYFKSAPQLLGRLTLSDIEEWVEKGLGIVRSDKDKGFAYFSLLTGSSRDTVETLVKGLELKEIHSILSKLASVMTDKRIFIRSSDIFYRNLPGLSRFFSATDGVRIFLPSRISVFEDQEMNFKTYKCALVHEMAHIMFGTFALEPHDQGKLFNLKNSGNAFKIFEFLEDERVDYLIGLQYPGIERDRKLIIDAYMNRLLHDKRGKECGDITRGFTVFTNVPNLGVFTALLNETLPKVRSRGQSAGEVLSLALEVLKTMKAEETVALSECLDAYRRHFYRGIIDYDLVDESRSGMSKIINEMLERFRDKKKDVKLEDINEALIRIEESAGPESELLLWQARNGSELDELFEQVESVVADIEEENRIRKSVYYDEWDSNINDYRKDWCRVREIDMPSTTLLSYEETIHEYYGLVSLLRRHFGLLRPDRVKRYFREERGDDLDLDAVIESIVERHAGIPPSDKVYIRRDKKLRDVSVAFLVDMSYSTSESLPSGKRIIDIERDALILMGEALESIGDHWAVFGFSTNYKDRVDFYVVRDFQEPFTDDVRMRFDGIRPIAQTRLGAAIRHANSFLKKQNSLIRLLILLSDGRPYDMDYGDLKYSVEDTRMALWEGRRSGITSYCITVDKRSREYLPYMYGESNYTIIDNIEALPATLPLIYKRLTT